MNYLVVLFKNKKRKKIFKSFITKKKAESYFNKKIEESKKVKFGLEVENANEVKHELLLLSLNDNLNILEYKQDELGRNLKLELVDSDYKILRLEDYNIPEKIFDWNKNKRITFEQFISFYFKTKELKSIYTINNKVVVQIDDQINIFSMKNIKESERFLYVLQEYMVSEKRSDGLFVKDLDTAHRKYLYELLEKNGVDKKRLYRQSTTFSERK